MTKAEFLAELVTKIEKNVIRYEVEQKFKK